jgi:hypothetical protein
MATNVLTVSTPVTGVVLHNLIPRKSSDEGNTYFHCATNAGNLTIMKYNPVTEVVTDFLVASLATLTYAVNYKPMCLDPYDRKMYFVACSQANQQQGLVYSLDTSTDTFASVKQLTTYTTDTRVDCQTIASDNTYIYVSVGRQPNWSLIAIRKSDGLESILATEPSTSFLNITQYRGGAIANIAGVDTYLYDGALAGAVGVAVQPWTSIDGEAETKGTELRLDVPTIDYSESDPDEVGNITIGYKYVGEPTFRTESGTITIYEDYTKGGLQLPNGDIFITGKAYSGYGLASSDNTTFTQFPRLAVSPCNAFRHSNGKIYISGYPSAATFEYDPYTQWSSTNPTFIDYFDTISNSHKTRCMMEDKNGYLWIAGHMMRDGVGGGVEWWNPITLDHGGVQGALIDGMIYEGCSAGQGQYICLSSKGVNLNTDGVVFIMNADTKAITEVTPSIGRYDDFAGDIVSFNGSDNRFYGINTNLARTECDIFCYDASDLTQKWHFTIPSSKETYTLLNRDDYQKLIASSDGYLYTVIETSGAFILYRIDPISGGIEALSKNTEGYRLTDIQGNSFFIENVVSKKFSLQTDAKLIDNMPTLNLSPLSVADVFIDMETKASTYRLMNRGTDATGSYDSYNKGLIADAFGDWDIQGEMANNLLQPYDYSGVAVLHHVVDAETITWSVSWEVTDDIDSGNVIAGYNAEFGGFEFRLVKYSFTSDMVYAIQLDGVTTVLPTFTTAGSLHHLSVTMDRTNQKLRYSLDGGVFVEVLQTIAGNTGWAFGIGNYVFGSTEPQLKFDANKGSTGKIGGVRMYLNTEFTLQSQFDADYAEAKAVYTTLLP